VTKINPKSSPAKGGYSRDLKNRSLKQARSAKNDEFYTQLQDIESELKNYRKHFKGKVVFCNCDDPEESHFWKYFARNFEFLGLKKLVSTHYERDNPSYKLEIIKDVNGDGKVNQLDTVRTPLSGNGDFRSDECVEILRQSDVIVTNPPFSLFREYVAQLIEHNKLFLVIGNMNAITYKEIFGLIRDDRVWLGFDHPKKFIQPDGSIKEFGNILSLTAMESEARAVSPR